LSAPRKGFTIFTVGSKKHKLSFLLELKKRIIDAIKENFVVNVFTLC
jgi:hypothetical protein